MPFVDSVLRINRLPIVLAVFLSLLKFSISETCLFKSTCLCVFQNGSIIDLTSLGNHDNSARWESMTSELKDEFTYYYNPCFSFTLGPSDQGCAKGVAVCQVDEANKKYYDCGDSESVQFDVDNKANVLKLIYSASQRTTNVSLICSENATTPKLTVVGEVNTAHYAMKLETRCACPDLCTSSHLSTGSVLVIIFMTFITLYLLLGIVHSSLTRGAHGWELIPHYEFWADFPLLVRDGCVFVVGGCKPETAYEKI